jgi:TatD DNase family protein
VKWIDIHTHKAYKKDTDVIFIRNAYMYPVVPENKHYLCSNGLHPWKINDPFDTNKFVDLLTRKPVVAIGEIGLDRLKPDFEKQLFLFKKQLQIGQQFKLPIIVHCVKAYPETIALLKTYPAPIVFHQYEGNSTITKELLAQDNVYFSFGKQLFRKQIPECLNQIPLERIFLETDTSPKHVKACYSQLASLMNIEHEELQLQILKNFKTVFANKIA